MVCQRNRSIASPLVQKICIFLDSRHANATETLVDLESFNHAHADQLLSGTTLGIAMLEIPHSQRHRDVAPGLFYSRSVAKTVKTVGYYEDPGSDGGRN